MTVFCFDSCVSVSVKEKKPKGRDEIIRVVNEYAASLSEELIRSMTNNIIKRARLCVDQNGGHFEHLLNKNEE